MKAAKVILLACGSFNPPTNMHLRMFEIARDHLQRFGIQVIAGIISPVHDGYAKAGLVSVNHRLKMIELAAESNNWIFVSDWESRQETWQRTRASLQYHQNYYNDFLKNGNITDVEDNDTISVKLLCGADLLESFGVPGLWSTEDIENIVGRHGLVVISRENSNPQKFIYNSDLLTKHMSNITIVTEWIKNEVSSTKIRKALRRHESVRYLIPDNVIDYITTHGLYGSETTNEYLFLPEYHPNTLNNNPSPETLAPVISSVGSYVGLNGRLPCMNLCNNSPQLLSIDQPDSVPRKSFNDATVQYQSSVTSTTGCITTGLMAASPQQYQPIGSNRQRNHPGQAVKVILPEIRNNKVHTATAFHSNCTNSTVDTLAIVAATKQLDKQKTLSSLQSHGDVDNLANCSTLTQDASCNDLKYKSCDENFVRFIFTTHGIQVISDVETIV